MSSYRPALRFEDGPLVWIDCEMTGLDPQKHKIIEIAVIITNGNLEPVDQGVNYVIKTDKKDLDMMDAWCVNQHGSSGLTKACLESPHSHEFVNSSVLAYIKRWIPAPRVGVLAGNSVHADKAFLKVHSPAIIDWLHYRIVDVSSIKELTRRWYPSALSDSRKEICSHRALDDIKGSIRELKWYRDNIFVSPANLQTGLASKRSTA